MSAYVTRPVMILAGSTAIVTFFDFRESIGIDMGPLSGELRVIDREADTNVPARASDREPAVVVGWSSAGARPADRRPDLEEIGPDRSHRGSYQGCRRRSCSMLSTETIDALGGPALDVEQAPLDELARAEA